MTNPLGGDFSFSVSNVSLCLSSERTRPIAKISLKKIKRKRIDIIPTGDKRLKTHRASEATRRVTVFGKIEQYPKPAQGWCRPVFKWKKGLDPGGGILVIL